MGEMPPNPKSAAVRHRRTLAGFIAMTVFAVVIVAAYRASRQPPETAWPGSVMLVGAAALVVAFATWLRTSGVMGVLEAIWDAICAVGSCVGAVFAAIWSGFLSLIGWD